MTPPDPTPEEVRLASNDTHCLWFVNGARGCYLIPGVVIDEAQYWSYRRGHYMPWPNRVTKW